MIERGSETALGGGAWVSGERGLIERGNETALGGRAWGIRRERGDRERQRNNARGWSLDIRRGLIERGSEATVGDGAWVSGERGLIEVVKQR